MPFLVLIVLTLICLQGKWPAPPEWLGAAGSALATWLFVAALAALMARTSRRMANGLKASPGTRDLVQVRLGRVKRWQVWALLAGFAVQLYGFGWGWTVHRLLTFSFGPFPGRELLVVAPFLVGLVFRWSAHYDVERAVHESATRPGGAAAGYGTIDVGRVCEDAWAFPSRAAFVGLQARHNFILVVPAVLLLVLQQALLALLPAQVHDSPWLMPSVAGLLVIGVFLGVPWLLRLFLGLRPLPECPLRRQLLAAARRVGFRCNDILLWDTRDTLANAMVMGPLPLLRYVVLTDLLVREMTPEEVEAVFGHEIGHIKHHHMLFYFGFLVASLLLFGTLWNAVDLALGADSIAVARAQWIGEVRQWLESYQAVAVVPLVVLLCAYVVVVFGFLSRRCERQADIFGCGTVSVPVFIGALEKVARLNGISRERPGLLSSWQHSTIARRVAFLERLRDEPALGARFQRRVAMLKWGMVVCLGLFLWALYAALGPEGFWKTLQNL